MKVIYIAFIIFLARFSWSWTGISFGPKLSTSKNFFVGIGWLPGWTSYVCAYALPPVGLCTNPVRRND